MTARIRTACATIDKASVADLRPATLGGAVSTRVWKRNSGTRAAGASAGGGGSGSTNAPAYVMERLLRHPCFNNLRAARSAAARAAAATARSLIHRGEAKPS